MTNIHPIVVHFPFALLAAALLLELGAVLFRRDELSRLAWWNQILGTLGFIASVASGLLAERTVRFSEPAREVFETHEQIAFFAAALFAGLLFWRIAAKGRVPERPRFLFLLLLAAAVILMTTGAWFGGELVYKYGVGVG